MIRYGNYNVHMIAPYVVHVKILKNDKVVVFIYFLMFYIITYAYLVKFPVNMFAREGPFSNLYS